MAHLTISAKSGERVHKAAVRTARTSCSSIGFVASALTAAGRFAAYTYPQPLLVRSAHLTYSNLSWALVAYGVAGALGTFAAE